MSDQLEDNQFLIFLLNGETFGLKILKIKEIIEHSEITRVPMMPRYIRGIINLRGNVVPVVDLNQRFYNLPTEIGKKTCIIIVESISDENKTEVGVMVDIVNEVIEIKNIEPPPSFGSKIKTEYVEGIGKMEDHFIVLLNMDSVLDIEEIETIKNEHDLQVASDL